MRTCVTIWLGILCGAGVGLRADAITPGPSAEQYQNIPERNVFGLKSGEAESTNTAPKGPPPRLTLTGITALLGSKLALMRAAIPPAPGAPAQEKPIMLAEGQRDGNIEVLAIDEHAKSVRVNDAGEVMTLTFAKDGVKPPAPPAAGTHQTNYATPGFYPGLNSRMRVMPTRMPRTPVTGAAPGTGAASAAGIAPPTGAVSNATAAGPATTPSAADMALSPTGLVPAPNPATNQNQLSPEALLLLQALQQEANNRNPTPPPPPPVPGVRTPYFALPPGANQQRANPPLMPQ